MSAVVVHTPDPAVEAASAEIVGLRSEFEKMLGGAIGVERFERAVLTAIQRDPDLLTHPRDSLVSAGLKAAQDRLLPDGREGAFVVRWNSKARRKEVTWAPMVFGIVKVAKQYAGVRSLSCEIVYEGEPFRILMGDGMRIDHERIPSRVVQGKEVGCYAIFCLADGERIREFMTAAEIRQVEESSESAKKGVGPWKAWRGEMMRKSVIRRLSKKVPTLDEGGAALRRVIERVDEDYSFGRSALEAAPSDAVPASALVAPSAFRMDALRDALDACQDAAALRAYLEGAETWLSRLRRNHPDRAREADAMVVEAWACVRGQEDAWAIVGSDGKAAEYPGREEWLAAWKARVDAIEAAPRSVPGRRAVLDRLLGANAEVLRRMEKRGSIAAAFDATALAAAADGRLAAQEQGDAAPALAAE